MKMPERIVVRVVLPAGAKGPLGLGATFESGGKSLLEATVESLRQTAEGMRQEMGVAAVKVCVVCVCVCALGGWVCAHIPVYVCLRA